MLKSEYERAKASRKEECDGCGSTDYKGDLRVCKFCGDTKCEHCDLGDDTTCLSCEGTARGYPAKNED